MPATATILASLLLAQTPKYDLRKDPEPVPGQPYARYLTHDRYGREITFYMTENATRERLPLVVFVQGSGSGSNFIRLDNRRIVPQNGQTSLYDVAQGKVRLLIVEKPGVKFLDSGRGGVPANAKEFRTEHTLDRWAEAVSASLHAVRKAPGIDFKRTLVMGHSEGGLVACRVAALNPSVTHVANLSGGGVTQLYDLIALARKGLFAGPVSEDPEKRVAFVVDGWKQVLADPKSVDRDYLGHPYRRWSSFLSTSPLQELAKFNGRIYIGQGLEDAAVDFTSADALYAQLLSQGKDVTYDRVPGVNHSFSSPTDQRSQGWRDEMTRVATWFLGSPNLKGTG